MGRITAQACGMLLLMVILYIYSRHKSPPTRNTRAFRLVMGASMASIALDAASVLMIRRLWLFGRGPVAFWCKLYLASLILVGLSAFLYLTGEMRDAGRARLAGRLAAGAAAAGAACVGALPVYIHDGEDGIYTHGPAVLATYALALSFIALTFAAALALKGRISAKRRTGVLAWMGGLAAAAAVQFFNNELLLVGYASSLGVLFLFSELENPAMYLDAETGLYNAKAARDRVAEGFLAGRPPCGVMMTVDALAGDLPRQEAREAAVAIADGLRAMRAEAYRMEWHTFAVITGTPEEADRALAGMREAMALAAEGTPALAASSARYAVLRDGHELRSAEEFIDMYYHVRSGAEGPGVITVDRALAEKAGRREAVRREISLALDEGRVEVFFQPIYDTRRRAFPSAEALARIRARDGSVVPPSEFIGVAEETGLIVPLGERVFTLVCDFLESCRGAGLGIEYMEVNLSAVQCEQKQLHERFAGIMRERGISPGQINLEITETMQLDTRNAMEQAISRFLDMGVRFSLDDFGTGNSNLDYMAAVPVNIVKFDHTMTRSYFENEKARIIFRHIVPMIKSLGLEIVCEGVETKEQLKEMESHGIEHIQGYYFARPMAREEYVRFLKEHNGREGGGEGRGMEGPGEPGEEGT